MFPRGYKPRGHTLTEIMVAVGALTLWFVAAGGAVYIGTLLVKALQKYIGS